MPEKKTDVNATTPLAKEESVAPKTNPEKPETKPTVATAVTTKTDEKTAVPPKLDANKSAAIKSTPKKATEAETLSKSEKFLSALGYLPFFFLLPLFAKKDSPYCQYHAKQGLVVTLIFMIIGVLGVNKSLENMIGFIHILVIGFFGFMAIRGQKKEVPMVSEMAQSEYLDF